MLTTSAVTNFHAQKTAATAQLGMSPDAINNSRASLNVLPKMVIPSTDKPELAKSTPNPTSSIGSKVVDSSPSSQAPTVRRGRGRGHGRLSSAGGSQSGRGSVGEGVKRKAGSDVPGSKAKKPRTALPPPPPRETSKRYAFDSLVSK